MKEKKRKATKEEKNAKRRAYYLAHRDKIREQNKASRNRNKEKHAQEGSPRKPKGKPYYKDHIVFADNPDRALIIAAIRAEDEEAARKMGGVTNG